MRLTRRGECVAGCGIALGILVVLGGANMLATAITGVDDTKTAGVETVEEVAPAPATTPTVTRSPMPRVRPSAASRSRLTDPTVVSGSHLSSTAYCETGLMANGEHTRRYVVAGNRWKLGTVLHVSDSPYGPGEFTVLDRIGHGSDLDFAMPGDCDGARNWGRRVIFAWAVQ